MTTPIIAPSTTTSAPAPAEADSQLDASFDIVARQDRAEADIATLRGDVDEVKARLDKVARAAARPAIGGTGGIDRAEVKGFVDGYLRRGSTAEIKSLTAAVPGDGGYAVPQEIDAVISRALTAISPIRRIAQVVQTGTAGYRKLIASGGTASGWVSEAAGRPETGTPGFHEIAPPTGELYANPAASQTMIDDAAFDIEGWLADEIAREFSRAEGAAFIGGSGDNQPRGFLNGPITPEKDSTRAFGTLQYIATGDGLGLGTELELRLVDIVQSLNAGYRQGASWVMNSTTLSTIRKLRTADGAFLWQPAMAEGQPDRLLGYPVVEAEDMPDIDIESTPVAFGNFRAGYLIAERSATQILRDPFTNKPFVHFYATKRVGGQLLDSNAIKLLRIAE
ncbi:phage major capsid protein [Tsuneonella suprasediminis]|uniref:phage major capsid protein n=1 Tax=Tsuneonella suprasediminis TaxID=2306996 RepID=UPI002F94C4B3